MKWILTNFLFCLSISCALSQEEMKILWQTDSILKNPESVAYDKRRKCVYVSNMDKSTPPDILHTDPISKISIDGQHVEVEWMSGLSSPMGLVLKNKTLYVVESNGIAIINVKKKKIIDRINIPEHFFLNDLAIDRQGRIFVSDTKKTGTIYLIQDGKAIPWLVSEEINDINGILSDRKSLIVGVNGDGYLKKINVKSQKIEKIAYLGPGNIDGIQKLNRNEYLVSLFVGNLYKINENGDKVEVYNTRGENIFMADFTFISKSNLLFIPSLRTHKIYCIQYAP